jgi:hypothetical protein
MSTQIYIQPPVTAAGCQPEYTKIVSHSFGFQPSGLPIAGQIGSKIGLHTGGTINITVDYDYPTWAADVRNFRMPYIAGNITDLVYSQISATGIPIPINLVRDDVVTISGNAYLNNLGTYVGFGYDVNLVVGVYYFNCKEVSLELGSAAPVFTFMPVSTIPFTDPKKSEVCFEASVKLGSNFDVHDTRLLVGYNIFATCPGECEEPFIDANVATVSYTLDIQRPCKAVNTSFIIKNCCEGSITELVNIPGLVVGNFHVDNEGNCWEVIDTSTDVTNFTRTFVDNYTTCLECQDANPCPLNLTIQSCCVEGIEYVTGSLPGLVVGDTFVDNHGLCWYVNEESGAPISEESITVVSIIEGDCKVCTEDNPCPYFYYVLSCCTNIGGIIALPDLLSVGDAFVDTTGICWVVDKDNQNELPTMYGIVVDTVYPIGEGDTCDECTLANPCPTEYFITIKSCCDNDRVEVAQVPANYMIFSEGTVFRDYWGICWEVLSFNTTGIATFEIWPWNDEEPGFSSYKECRECLENNGCNGAYNIKDCQTDIVYSNVVLNTGGPPSIGGSYVGTIFGSFGEFLSCFEVLSLGYPTYPGSGKGELKEGPFATCLECELVLDTTKTLEFSQCCGGPNIIVEYTGVWSLGIGGTAMIPLSTEPEILPYIPTCVTLIGYSTMFTNLFNQPNNTVNYDDCVSCTDEYGCPE